MAEIKINILKRSYSVQDMKITGKGRNLQGRIPSFYNLIHMDDGEDVRDYWQH